LRKFENFGHKENGAQQNRNRREEAKTNERSESIIPKNSEGCFINVPYGQKTRSRLNRRGIMAGPNEREQMDSLPAYLTGLVNQELLLQNEYLAAENRVLRAHLPARLRLSDPERSMLAEIGKRLGRKALGQVASVAKPDTILAWYRKLIAHKFDGSKYRRYPGRPRIEPKLEALIVQMAKENSGWGYDRIVGALANLGYQISDQTVGNVLKPHGIAPALKRSQTTTWKEFIQSHMAVLAGIDFFMVEVLTWRGLVTYYILFFIHLESRRVSLAGITRHPDQAWMQQMARNATGDSWNSGGTHCTIATPSSARSFGRRSRLVV
jgi:hypothetical protein